MKIAISAETTIDLGKDLLAKYQISTVPYTLVMGEKSYTDGEVKGEDLFAYTEKTGKLAHSAAVNEHQFHEQFAKLLKDNEAVIHFTLSSDMSMSYTNACKAAKEFKNVYVIDTRSLSTGIALLAIFARKLAGEGVDVKEVVKRTEARVKDVQASFALESVNYLYKGGRCSALANFGANLLHLRPQILVKDGKMLAGKKFRGPIKKWVNDYVDETLLEFNNPDHSIAFITYSSAPADVVEEVKARLYKEGFKEVYNTNANGTVCCHCGPNCLGILYMNDGDGTH
jgi:DegV family protein with EDD domain